MKGQFLDHDITNVPMATSEPMFIEVPEVSDVKLLFHKMTVSSVTPLLILCVMAMPPFHSLELDTTQVLEIHLRIQGTSYMFLLSIKTLIQTDNS
jgi:hypothetical protein